MRAFTLTPGSYVQLARAQAPDHGTSQFRMNEEDINTGRTQGYRKLVETRVRLIHRRHVCCGSSPELTQRGKETQHESDSRERKCHLLILKQERKSFLWPTHELRREAGRRPADIATKDRASEGCAPCSLEQGPRSY